MTFGHIFLLLALNCWGIFNCKAYSRVDIIVSNNKPYVLEINTLPDMTKNSLFPKSAKGIGLEYNNDIYNLIKISKFLIKNVRYRFFVYVNINI